jgi:tetratricopeptide (TPR) repeat protein
MYKLAARELRADEARRQSETTDPAAALRAIEQDATVSGLVFKPYRLAVTLARGLPPSTRFDRARRALTAAARLGPALALAHYYLGEVYREQDNPRAAAEAFTRAIQADPSQPLPYIALAELYRGWVYIDQSLLVAQQGIAHGSTSAGGDLWYELGMAHDAKHHDADALAAFSQAARGGNKQARFQRGQIYFRRNELANATQDLEAFVSSAGPSLALAKQIAGSLLIEIARKLHAPKVYMHLPTRMDPRDEQRH